MFNVLVFHDENVILHPKISFSPWLSAARASIRGGWRRRKSISSVETAENVTCFIDLGRGGRPCSYPPPVRRTRVPTSRDRATDRFSTVYIVVDVAGRIKRWCTCKTRDPVFFTRSFLIAIQRQNTFANCFHGSGSRRNHRATQRTEDRRNLETPRFGVVEPTENEYREYRSIFFNRIIFIPSKLSFHRFIFWFLIYFKIIGIITIGFVRFGRERKRERDILVWFFLLGREVARNFDSRKVVRFPKFS